MAVVTLGSQTSPTVVGGDVTVTTGTSISTLPVSSPIVIQGTGNHADSLWNYDNGKIVPENLAYHVGLGLVDDSTLTDHILLFDDSTNEIKKINGSLVAPVVHTHAYTDIVSGLPTTLAGYGITDAQSLDADLTSIAALGYASTSFLKKTGSNTWALDTATYSPTSHTHAYQTPLPPCEVNDYILSGQTDGTYSWVPFPVVTGGGGGAVDLSGYAPIAAPAFTTSFGFSTWRFTLSGNDLLISYSGVPKGKLTSAGAFVVLGEVTAFGTI
jgi:hypothetical protein